MSHYGCEPTTYRMRGGHTNQLLKPSQSGFIKLDHNIWYYASIIVKPYRYELVICINKKTLVNHVFELKLIVLFFRFLFQVLNTLAVDPGRVWKGVWRWYHEDMLDCCVPLQVMCHCIMI